MALERDQAFLDRGGRMKTLYQHTTRHVPTVQARFEQLRGHMEVRTLDEVTERLLVIDRSVAYIPANRDRTLALEIRHPALVTYLATTFDRLWRLATPVYPQPVPRPTLNGVTPRQRAIAALLIEGHTDAVIAERLGMNIRTARVHIAKLAATLGSDSRAQLGYLIGATGILKQEDAQS
jgi:DNA-binding NarL/FixJ family response regulator